MSADRYGNTKIRKIKAAYDDLRAAVRAGDSEAAQSAFDRYEQWADCAVAPRTDLTPPAADYVTGPVQNDTIESFCATLRRLIADANLERDRFSHIAATIRINALHHGATNAEVEAMLSGEISFVNWIADKVEALAARPASPDTRVTPQEAAQVLLDTMRTDPPLWDAMVDAAETIHETGVSFNRVIAAALRVIIGGQDRG